MHVRGLPPLKRIGACRQLWPKRLLAFPSLAAASIRGRYFSEDRSTDEKEKASIRQQKSNGEIEEELTQDKFIQNIDKVDLNKDGVLSPEEFDKFLEREEFLKKFYRRSQNPTLTLRINSMQQPKRDSRDNKNGMIVKTFTRFDTNIRIFLGFMRSTAFREKYEQGAAVDNVDGDVEPSKPIPVSLIRDDPALWQLNALFIRSAVPFFCFGFVDNFIMLTHHHDHDHTLIPIRAGDFIDVQLGGRFHLSTLAAAGFGADGERGQRRNKIILSPGIIEEMSTKLGLPDPRMTYTQLQSAKSRAVRHAATVIGIALGCLAGMVPLWFLPEHEKENKT
eukprot:jgi/Bigna1/67524/fgenesh1_pg.4_\